MKKMLWTWVAIAITLLISVNVYKTIKTETITDQYILDRYVEEERGDTYYGVIWEDNTDDEYIGYLIYDENDELRYVGSCRREYYMNKYCE